MIPKPPEHVATLSDNTQLAAFVDRLRQCEWVAVDTEFLRERTYYPELCLVQIASNNEIGLIDTLAIDDLEPLAALMGDHRVIKVFHAADQDLEVLTQRLEVTPAPVFDTQIATALCGMGDQIGYARMVEILLDIHLPKDQTRTDWSRRPLPSQALDYAADDVRFLAVAYPMLCERLHQLGRSAWAESDNSVLAANASRLDTVETAWRRVRAWRKLEPAQQQVVAALAQWREHEAMRANRPRRWILSDEALVTLARRQPKNADQLAATKDVPNRTAKRHGPALVDTVRDGLQRPAVVLAPQPEPLTGMQKALCKTARNALAICARLADVPAPMLARRKDLEQLVRGDRNVPALEGWRAEVAGHAIVDVIEGRRHIIGSGDTATLSDVIPQ